MYWRCYLVLLLVTISCTRVSPPVPILPIPSERQLAWHDLEYYAFVHFNMNTFTNNEWGMGNENPQWFNPTALDCKQWARVCKAAGMKGIIITAKHHDGFCLWPSAYTEHSVKNSPWKNGNGDVICELADACNEYGLKLGIYLSPWDRNRSDYGTPEYLTYFRNQLKELLTNYGNVFEVWFDGANGGTGYYGGANETRTIDRKTYYDWETTYKLVREIQPEACLFSDIGPDVRWVGNEEGYAMKTNWAPVIKKGFYPGTPDYKELREGHINGTHWIPAEVDVSIRPGWYYHQYEDHKVKSLPHLLDVYYNSIGRNASLLINFPITPQGLIHDNDVSQILKLADAIKADFANNLALKQPVTATNTRGNSKIYAANNVTDTNPDTYWATNDGVTKASITIDMEKPTEINRLLVQEHIKLGQRVKKFTVQAFTNGNWQQIASETTIGRKRILRFNNVKASKVRLNIEDAKGSPVISNIELYKAPKVLLEPEITRNKQGQITIKSFDSGLQIYYTLDGTMPNKSSNAYTQPFINKEKCEIKAIAYDVGDDKQSPVTTVNFDIVREKWKFNGVLKNNPKALSMLDGNPKTAYSVDSSQKAWDVVIDLGETQTIKGFKYLPDQGRWNPGVIARYAFYVSYDGKKWGSPVLEDEFSNIKNNPIEQSKIFMATSGRFIKLVALSPAETNGRVGIAELELITE